MKTSHSVTLYSVVFLCLMLVSSMALADTDVTSRFQMKIVNVSYNPASFPGVYPNGAPNGVITVAIEACNVSPESVQEIWFEFDTLRVTYKPPDALVNFSRNQGSVFPPFYGGVSTSPAEGSIMDWPTDATYFGNPPTIDPAAFPGDCTSFSVNLGMWVPPPWRVEFKPSAWGTVVAP